MTEKKPLSKRKTQLPGPLSAAEGDIRTPRDLALDALAEIQALDAEPAARAFREKWLSGNTFSEEAPAIEWMYSVADEARPNDLVFRVRLSAAECREHLSAEIGRSGEDLASLRREWAESNLREHWDAITSQFTLAPVKPTIEYHEVDNPRGYDHQFWASPGSALADLAELVADLVKTYRWEDLQAIRFVLGGVEPVIPAMRVQLRGESRIAAKRDRTPAASPHMAEIILRCRPQVTRKQVAEAYEDARRLAFAQAGFVTGERNRPITSERTRDLAVLGFRIHRGEFASWRDAFDTYASEHPSDGDSYRLKSRGEVQVKVFRRDTRAAYERVTGWQLEWRPDMREPGVPVEILTDEED